MRRTTLRLIVAVALLPFAFLLALLFIPPFGGYLVEESVSHLLKHRLTLGTFHLTPGELLLEGTFDDNSTLQLRAGDLLTPRRRARLQLHGNTRLFNAVTRGNLPDVDLNATATYSGEKLQLQAALLGGSLDAEMNLTTHGYSYRARSLRIERLLMAYDMPAYASGPLFAEGNGTAAPPYPQHAGIISDNIIIDTPLIAPFVPKTELPLRIYLASTVNFRSGHLLKSTLSLSSPAFAVSSGGLTYDTENGAFTLPLALENRALSALPFKAFLLRAMGKVTDADITADALADVDGFVAILNNITITPERGRAACDYRLSSVSAKPFNLHGDNALFGTLRLKGHALEATAATRKFASPLALRYRDGNLSIISNNIPLETLLGIANLPPVATAKIDLNASLALGGERPRGSLRLQAKKVMPAPDTARDLNMTRSGTFRLEAFDTKNGYGARLDIASQLLRTEKPAELLYDVTQGDIRLDATLLDVALSQYRAARLDLHARYDPKRMLLRDASLLSPYERIDIPSLSFGTERNGRLHYRLTHLERFTPELNASYALEGSGTLLQEGNTTRLTLRSGTLGEVQLLHEGATYRLDAAHVGTGPLFRLLGRPALFDGNLSLSAAFNGRQGTATLRAARLVPLGEMRRLLRPFPLDASFSFLLGVEPFSAEGSLRTAFDTLTLPHVEFSRSGKSLRGYYRAAVADRNRSALLLPPQLDGPVMCRGTFEADKARQYLTLNADAVLSGAARQHYLHDTAAPLPLSLSLEARRGTDGLSLKGTLRSERFTLNPLRLRYDHGHLDIDAGLLTDLWLGNSTLGFEGALTPDGRLSDASLTVQTASHDLNLTGLYADAATGDYRADLSLSLQPLAEEKRKAPPALLIGSLRSLPTLEARLWSQSFDGRISAVMNDTLLIVHAEKVSLNPLMSYFKAVPYLQSGTLDARIILDTAPLLAKKPEHLDGGIDLKLQNLSLKGVDLDSYLSTLRNTQDLSLFQGSLLELPIVRSLRELPATLQRDTNLSTLIPQARLAASIRDGILTCEDCAAATTRHRFAFAGDINATSQRFSHFYFALLNPEGCPYFLQHIQGRLSSPNVNLAEAGINVIGGAVVSLASNVTDAATWLTGIVHFVTTVTGEVIAYIPIAGKTTGETLTGVSGTLHDVAKSISGCIPFYLGSIPHPRP